MGLKLTFAYLTAFAKKSDELPVMEGKVIKEDTYTQVLRNTKHGYRMARLRVIYITLTSERVSRRPRRSNFLLTYRRF